MDGYYLCALWASSLYQLSHSLSWSYKSSFTAHSCGSNEESAATSFQAELGNQIGGGSTSSSTKRRPSLPFNRKDHYASRMPPRSRAMWAYSKNANVNLSFSNKPLQMVLYALRVTAGKSKRTRYTTLLTRGVRSSVCTKSSLKN